MSDDSPVGAMLQCPVTGCDREFWGSYDESAVTSLVYHLNKRHPDLSEALHWKIGGKNVAH